MRRTLLIGILGGCLVVGVLPALAADKTVNAGFSSWSENEFAVQPGDTITWVNASGNTHNLHVDGVQVVTSGAAWSYDSTYPARETAYPFHCSVHPASMSGRFFVNASGTVPTPTPTPSPSATPTPTPTTTPGGGGGGGGGGSGPGGGSAGTEPAGSAGTTVTRFRAAPTRDHFCTRRGPTCRRPGVFLSLDLGASAPVRVRGTLRRRPLVGGRERRFGTVAFTVRPGRRRVKLPGRRLTPGRYVLDLRAGDIARRLRFRVRPS